MTAKVGSHLFILEKNISICMLNIDQKKIQKQHLRKQLRASRIDASRQFSDLATISLAAQLTQLRIYRTAKNIAVYLPFKSEFPTQSIIQSNLKMGKRTFVPKITSTRRSKMQFVELDHGIAKRFLKDNCRNQLLAKNTLGIDEPENSFVSIKAQSIDIIFVPLLGFDTQGSRLGMGGGYYDRALAFKKSLQKIPKPYLIGLAYQAQHIEKLQTESWDVSLDAVITEDKIYSMQSRIF